MNAFSEHDGAASSSALLHDTGPGNSKAASFRPLVARFEAAFAVKRIVWRTAQLREAGFGDRAIRRLLEQGILARLRYGCYVRAAWWNGLSLDARRLNRVLLHAFATLTSSATGFVYSHTSAAILHGLFLWNVDDFIHITQPKKPSSIGAGPDTRIHRSPLDDEDIVVIRRLRVTSLLRTVIDCALTLPYRQALIIADHALRMGVSLPTLMAAADRLSSHRGIRTLRKVLLNADPRSESPGETLTRDLMRKLLIEPPTPQVWIATRVGRHRVDFAWIAKRVVLEFDGKGKYFNYRPTDEALFQERKRETALIEAGWTLIRVQWKDLFNEAGFKLRILAALAK
ncbi:type IV toxin-antitoxin system AbiEi family antitoxin domain-containing protein [Arthrobacter cryoconiti]|uniref:Type IV toxin-antitoxin system AbiEi family antitoxin domain-containing protein n=1 Tax=Arthrobacter cryoconiti TaxID=748907 RepID=A0ABV8R4L7_9MICC|nr:type IV toxin-antitoxin system AbiEi family antitoxin domain-containing protein [Arthrobacter cryoconiti]MCC9066919.1 type IV toxin-antitoxin system AbiEi family antitoxin domain-containing protein [Arthrobacter cryoconiti]